MCDPTLDRFVRDLESQLAAAEQDWDIAKQQRDEARSERDEMREKLVAACRATDTAWAERDELQRKYDEAQKLLVEWLGVARSICNWGATPMPGAK
jgi:uncharacterized coiled-coil DUF342 family protein